MQSELFYASEKELDSINYYSKTAFSCLTLSGTYRQKQTKSGDGFSTDM
ncbi:MAG: hypothetical protein IPI77_23980 [Saprospiraceae bacterium]|nr:hypothetical protein [Saprospiraceae bacterium]